MKNPNKKKKEEKNDELMNFLKQKLLLFRFFLFRIDFRKLRKKISYHFLLELEN